MGFGPRPDFSLQRANGHESSNRKCKTEVGELSAARHPRERLGADENWAIIIERAFGVVSIARSLLNQFAIRLENSRICTGKMNALGMISQRLMAHAARHRAAFLIDHHEPNAVLFQVLVVEAGERHLYCLYKYWGGLLLQG